MGTPAAIIPPKPFDSAAYISDRNVAEEARRSGKTIEPKPAEPAAAEPAKPAKPEHLSRSDRRAQNRLHQELGAERARREALEAEVQALKGVKPAAAAAEPDPEPKRAGYATDAEYLRAATAWDGRQAEKKKAETDTAAAATESELQALRDEIAAAGAKSIEDKKLIPDYDEVAKAAEENEDTPEWIPDEHPFLMRLIATSDVKAFMLHHLALNPDVMQKLLDASGNLEKQASIFRRLEGKVESLHSSAAKPADKPADKPGDKKDEKPAEKKEPETAAERDARKARPSEAVAPHGGSAPSMDISPTLADGKTLNPAWRDRQNLRAERRR